MSFELLGAYERSNLLFRDAITLNRMMKNVQ